jgi:hypothetical protein
LFQSPPLFPPWAGRERAPWRPEAFPAPRDGRASALARLNAEIDDLRSQRHRERDLQAALRRRIRLEGSDIANGDGDAAETAPGRGRDSGFQRAIDALRADGLPTHREQQLVERYRRSREARLPPSASQSQTRLWGALSDDEDRPVLPPPTAYGRNDPVRQARRVDLMRRLQAREEERRGLEGRRIREIERGIGRPRAHGHDDLLDPRGFMDFFGGRDRPRLAALLGRGGAGLGDYMVRSTYQHLFFFFCKRSFLTESCSEQRDEDFDTSYEGLLRLSERLGDVRPRTTPENIISSLPVGRFADWCKEGSDTRCPICLDDVSVLFTCPPAKMLTRGHSTRQRMNSSSYPSALIGSTVIVSR